MTRPRLVHVTTTDMSLALLLGPQLEAFADSGYEVIGASAPGPYVAGLKERGIAHVPLRHATRSFAPHRDLAALAELRSVFNRLHPDIVHTHNPKTGVYGRLAARAAGVPVIVNTVHGLYAGAEDRWQKRAFVYGLERWAACVSHAELVQNLEDLETLARIGVPRSKLRLLGNGIDLARFDRERVSTEAIAGLRREIGAQPGDVVCSVVGRLVAEKGYYEVFRAAELLAERAPRVRIVVAGSADPDKADALRPEDIEVARRAGVHFVGFRADIESLYAASDLYLLASHREGFPRSAMEAAAMGLPIVATDIRGCRAVVDNGRNGLLVPLGDVAAIAEAVIELAGNGQTRREMGAEGHRKAHREFDQRQVVEKTIDAYERAGGCRVIALPSATRVRPGTASDAPAVARLHVAEIQSGFLSALGPAFLSRLYRRVALDPRSLLVVATSGERVQGFAAATEDVAALYRSFLVRDGVLAAMGAAPRLLRYWSQVWETLRYPGDFHDGPRAELLAVVVDPSARQQGLGRQLVDAVRVELARRGQPAGRVVVSGDNGAGLGLYRRCGFRDYGTIEIHSGTSSAVLTWS